MQIGEYLLKHRLIPDGSMGTYFSRLVNQQGAISEYANISAPEIIEQIHMDYLNAGARILRTNTFAANHAVLHINSKEQESLVRAACQIAKKACREFIEQSTDMEPVWILGDIGPIPVDAYTQDHNVIEEYQRLCDIFIDEGLDGIHFETFPSLKYIDKIIPYIKEKKQDMFLVTSFSVNKNGFSTSGISAARLMEKVSHIDEIDACGFNCGIGSGHMYQILKKISFPDHKLIYAAPNAGYPEQMQNRMVFMDNEDYFTKNIRLIADLGIDIIGGCCGTTPDYIKKLVENIPIKDHLQEPSHLGQKISDEEISVRGNEFYRLFERGKKVIAVELDPPYDSNIDSIMECAHELKSKGIDIITLADSPMGRSRVDSILMSSKIAEMTGMHVMPHVCCRDRNMISMRSSLLGAYIHGIRNMLIVTGDPVPGESRISTTGVFDYNSIQLMEFVKEMNIEHFPNDPLYYGGALNFGRGSIHSQVARMKKKIDAGAKYFLTQPIFSKEDMERVRSIKEMLDTKILCGIMPLVSYRNACFIKNEITGIHVPDEIISRYHPNMTKKEGQMMGAAIAREMMELLDPIADGYYFMLPFNRVSLMDMIMEGRQ